jgi:hypothetical protein
VLAEVLTVGATPGWHAARKMRVTTAVGTIARAQACWNWAAQWDDVFVFMNE